MQIDIIARYRCQKILMCRCQHDMDMTTQIRYDAQASSTCYDGSVGYVPLLKSDSDQTQR